MLIQYIRRYRPYLKVFSSIYNLRMRHAVEIRDPSNMGVALSLLLYKYTVTETLPPPPRYPCPFPCTRRNDRTVLEDSELLMGTKWVRAVSVTCSFKLLSKKHQVPLPSCFFLTETNLFSLTAQYFTRQIVFHFHWSIYFSGVTLFVSHYD